MIILCMVAELWLETNGLVISGQFVPFYSDGGVKIKTF